MIRTTLRALRNTFVDATSWQARRRWNAAPYDIPRPVLDETRATLEKILTQSILRFWHPHTIDTDNGGYRINHDAQGVWQGQQRDRQAVSQVRTLWFFARLLTSPYRSEEYYAAARHGFEFVRDHFWDHEFGGLFWEVDSTGRVPTKADKHLYGQAFGLYALAEYAIATGDAQAESMARQLYALLEQHARDHVNGGYREFFRRDWQPVEPAAATYMESRADFKQLNTHVHLLEAFTRYSDLVQEPTVRERLRELILIMSNTVVRKGVTACTDIHAVDWAPSMRPAHTRVNYGHDVENIWLLIEACDSAAVPNALLREFYESLFHNAWHFGFDHRQGGFFYQGPMGRFATSRQKVWWVQAEALVCALHLYRLTRKEVYFRCFRETLDWINRRQVDWQVGEWHRRVESNGTASGSKTADTPGGWKTPYHNGRAIIRCLDLIGEQVSAPDP